jgi:hypothetical protein
MMKMRINIEFSSMDGIGPKAWDRDESNLAMHSYHPHPAQHHVVIRKPVNELLKEDADGSQSDAGKQQKE